MTTGAPPHATSGDQRQDRTTRRAALQHSTDEEATMSVWIILLIAALIAALVGFGSAAKWLFILAVIFLAAGLIGIFTRGRGTRV
jgi:fatty acid desaturase